MIGMDSDPCQKPCETLYIYYVEGCIDASSLNKMPAFMGNWIEDSFSFLFFSEDCSSLVDALVARQHLIVIDCYQMTYDDWHGGELTPFTAGDFIITPPWCPPPLHHNLKKIMYIDPGVVFGNGNHPTTQSCMDFIAHAFSHHNITSCLDIGTGTGLLAIAAALSGSFRNLAVDFNFLAARTAANNIAQNDLSNSILAIQGTGEQWIDWQCDLLIANIHYDVMKRLLAEPGLLNKNLFILSGLLKSQSLAVERQLGALPVRLIEKTSPDGIWYTYLGKVGV